MVSPALPTVAGTQRNTQLVGCRAAARFIRRYLEMTETFFKKLEMLWNFILI